MMDYCTPETMPAAGCRSGLLCLAFQNAHCQSYWESFWILAHTDTKQGRSHNILFLAAVRGAKAKQGRKQRSMSVQKNHHGDGHQQVPKKVASILYTHRNYLKRQRLDDHTDV